jgi:hypothetical protein
MTSCESAVNSIQCHRAHFASAGRRPDSVYSPQGPSGGPTTLRPIAAGDYRTRKRNDWTDAGRNICSSSTAAGPLTARRDGIGRDISIILAGRTRSPSGARAASSSSPYAVSSRAKKSPSTMARNIIGSFSRMAAAVARHAAPRPPSAGEETRHVRPGDLAGDDGLIAVVS